MPARAMMKAPSHTDPMRPTMRAARVEPAAGGGEDLGGPEDVESLRAVVADQQDPPHHWHKLQHRRHSCHGGRTHAAQLGAAELLKNLRRRSVAVLLSAEAPRHE